MERHVHLVIGQTVDYSYHFAHVLKHLQFAYINKKFKFVVNKKLIVQRT